jgi:hypothetical protein
MGCMKYERKWLVAKSNIIENKASKISRQKHRELHKIKPKRCKNITKIHSQNVRILLPKILTF